MGLTKKLNWGILGTGRICNKLVPAIQQAPSSCAYRIASRDPQKAIEAAKKFAIPNTAASYEELLQDKNIDVIYIPLPNALHLEWVIKAAQAKKHILCEKPLGISKQEAALARKTCQENGVKLLEGYMWPHHPRTLTLKKILESGRLGKIGHVEAALNFVLSNEYSQVRRTPELGGGALYDIGCYCIYGILWAMGEMPTSVFASGRFENGIDTEVTALLEFSENRTANFHCSFNHSYRGFLEIVGTEATLRIPQMWNPFSLSSAEIWEKGELKETFSFEKADQVATLVENFNQYILFDKELPIDPKSSENILSIIDALYDSAWTEEKVRI